MTPVLIFALELVVLYGCGSYAMGRMAAWGYKSAIGKAAFYLLLLPGVVLHESAHYLACLLTEPGLAASCPSRPGAFPTAGCGSATSGTRDARLLSRPL